MRRLPKPTLCLALTTLILVSAAHGSTSWPGLRGPHFDGTVPEARLFDGDEGGLEI